MEFAGSGTFVFRSPLCIQLHFFSTVIYLYKANLTQGRPKVAIVTSVLDGNILTNSIHFILEDFEATFQFVLGSILCRGSD